MRFYWIYLVVVITLGALFAVFHWPFILFVFIIVTLALVHLLYIYYVYHFSKDLVRIESYMKVFPQHALFCYALSLKYGAREDQLQAINRLLAKTSKPTAQAYYKILRAILLQDFAAARAEVATVTNKAQQQYMLALIAAHEGKQHEAANYELSKPWMIPFIEAILALQEHNFSDFKKAKASAIKHASGIQRFINAWYFHIYENHIKSS